MGMREMLNTFSLRGAANTWLVGGGAAALMFGLGAAVVGNAFGPMTSITSVTALAGTVAVGVALPLLYTCSRMARRIASLRLEVQRAGQRDGLTACLNEQTFSALVDTYADRRTAGKDTTRGTVVLIHLDELQSINDRFGHSWGNDALVKVAAAIRGTVRQGDIVGRVSGNQFGVFLPGANETDAKGVAERIHTSVTGIAFFPTGIRHPLSIRAGAVIVADQAKFDTLLKAAESTLELARGQDQDWIVYTSIGGWADREPVRLQ
ncbi:UNVERIFIED_ORG: GGDEF domain-containing protein (plasmid) [Roseateles sp. XES5]|nr:GGDEF domain-containing protein [Roseateles sp. XES5]